MSSADRLEALKRNQKVGNGRSEPEIGNFTFAVAIMLKDVVLRGHAQVCGGTIVSPYWVLTAAHCVEDRGAVELAVIAGVSRIYDHSSKRQIVDVEYFLPHPDYRTLRYNLTRVLEDDYNVADVALLKLATPIQMRAKQTTTTLLVMPDALNGYMDQENLRGIVAGWGLLRNVTAWNLYSTVVNLWTPGGCHAALPRSYARNIICGWSRYTGPCRGDSGGPLILPVNAFGTEYYVQVGIVSRGPQNCNYSRKIAYYMNAAHYCPWVQRMTNIRALCRDFDSLRRYGR